MIIKKAKLIKNGCLEVAYFDVEGNEIVLRGANPVHEDMKAAFKALVPFLCDLTEQKEADKFDWENPTSVLNDELTRRLDVSGVTISGSDTFRSCVITGKRTLLINKVLNFNTPSITLDADAEDYKHLDELQLALEAVEEEARLYVQEHKYSVEQKTLDFEASNDGADDPFGDEGDAGESQPLDKAV